MNPELILIDNRNETDPRLNLALEEFVFRNFVEGDYLLLYINTPSVIVGKHQNVLEEVDLEYAAEQGIRIVRRISGGGAVYHDLGNLNFSLITQYDSTKHNNYQPFLAPIITALDQLRIESRLNNRNSLIVSDGRKVSGNAQFVSRGRMMSHGTLLFNSDLDRLERVLNVAAHATTVGIESHAVQSVRSRVVNLAELLPEKVSIEEFRDHIARHFAHDFAQEIPVVQTLSEDEWSAVRTLAQEKYDSWEWNIGRSPKFTIKHRLKDVGPMNADEINGMSGPVVTIRVVDGCIQESMIERVEGVDAIESIDSSEALSSLLVGQRYEPEKINRMLERFYAGNAEDNSA